MIFFSEYIPKYDTGNPEQRIPKKIFMTWYTHNCSDLIYSNIQSWIELNPNYEIYLYDDKQALEFIEKNFDIDVINAYKNLFPTAYKADLFRYCILYVYGGIYLDIKISPKQKIDNIISESLEFLSVKDRFYSDHEFDGYIYQALLCSKPKQCFLKKAIELVVENSKNNYYGKNALSPTGPNLFGRAINLCLNKNATDFIEEGKHIINNICFELLPRNNDAILDSNFEEFCLCDIPGYRKELYGGFDIAKYYRLCWFHNKCYIDNKKSRGSHEDILGEKYLLTIEYLYITKNIKKSRISIIKYYILNKFLLKDKKKLTFTIGDYFSYISYHSILRMKLVVIKDKINLYSQRFNYYVRCKILQPFKEKIKWGILHPLKERIKKRILCPIKNFIRSIFK